MDVENKLRREKVPCISVCISQTREKEKKTDKKLRPRNRYLGLVLLLPRSLQKLSTRTGAPPEQTRTTRTDAARRCEPPDSHGDAPCSAAGVTEREARDGGEHSRTHAKKEKSHKLKVEIES